MRLSVLAGVLIGVAFLHAWLWFLALVGLALLAHNLATSKTYREAVQRSTVTGIVKGLIATVSLMDAFPVDWIGDVARSEQFIFLAFCWIGSGVMSGLGYAVLGALLHHIREYMPSLRSIAFGFALVASELAGSLLFSIYSLGPSNTVNANFGFGMSGFLLSEHYFLQSLAVLGGVYILSFAMGVTAYTAFLLWPQKKFFALFAGIVCVTSFIPGPHAWSSKMQVEQVAVVETAFGPYRSMSDSELLSRQRALFSGIEAAFTTGARITALPEDARLGVGIDPSLVASQLSQFAHPEGALVIDSYRTDVSNDSVVVRGYIYDLDQKRAYTSDKRYLVPVGEFIPWLHGSLMSLIGGSNLFAHTRYIPGDRTLDALLPDSVPTLMFCFESGATPLLADRIAHRNPSLIVHPVSHAWFHKPITLRNQERQMLIIQSIYTRIPILQAGNMAPSALYLPDGTVDYGTIVATGPRWKTILFGN